MKRFCFTLCFTLLTATISIAQLHEQLSPLQQNIELQKDQKKNYSGIYIYEIDTLGLPIQDDFSKDKFRKYNAKPGDANVTDSVFYLLEQGGIPFDTGTGFSLTPTQIIHIDTTAAGNDTIYFTTLPSQAITYNYLSNYPIISKDTFAYPCYNIIDTAYNTSDVWDTVYTTCEVIQDSVYVYFVASIDQTSAIWLDSYAYHNYRFGINPPTLGVVTFDGFDQYGFPYDFTLPAAEGIADFLTTKPIDLSTHTPADSIYLSFFYQPEGYGEVPETEDSLMLEFYIKDTGWVHAWSIPGVPLQDFKQVLIPVTRPSCFHNAFQFRFKNHAIISGSIDHWHVDYIYMNQFRSAVDTNRDDVAFRYEGMTLLKNNYLSMPLTHYALNPHGNMRDTVTFLQRNNNAGPRLVGLNEMYVSHEGTTLFSVPNPATPSVPALTDFKTTFDVGNAGVWYDTSLIDSCAEVFDVMAVHSAGGTDECHTNDTMRFSQTFSNFYAYDDGSAESAYGPIGANALLAYQFTLSKPDNLYGVAIHFSPNVNNESGKTFFLTVWNNTGAGGTPGSIIYQETVISDVIYENAHNKFHVYPFSTPLNVSGTIYIGWKQTALDKLNIGFDRNNNNQSKIYYDVGFGWTNTSFIGSLMMRPVFDICETGYVNVKEAKSVENNPVSIYPNPASEVVNIQSSELIEQVMVYDVSGKFVSGFGSTNTFSVRDISKGLYVVRIKTQSGITTHRLVIE